MAGQFGFRSPGASASNAIAEFLMQRAMQNRQQMLDELTRQDKLHDNQAQDQQLLLQRDQENRVAEAQHRAQSDLEQEREFRRAGTIADNALPDDAVDEDTRKLLTRQGFGGQVKQVPGILMQGPLQEGEARASSPDSYAMRGGSKYLSARAAEDARAAQATEAEAGRNERAQAANEVRTLLAQIAASGRADSTALRNDLLRIQTALAQDKLDTNQKAKTDAASAIATTRSQIRDLAQGLMNDPALDSISGVIDANTPNLRPSTRDAYNRYQQLKNMLTLEQRSKLKGQGQVSNWEGQMVEKGASALDLAAGSANVRQHLQELIDALQGDTPREMQGPPAPTGGGGGGSFRVVGKRPAGQ
jgi:hypothetical protein